MEYINESHTYYTIELRSSTGEIFTQYELKPLIFHHPDRDIAVLHLQEEDKALPFLQRLNFQLLETETYQAVENEELIFHGHEVFDSDPMKAFDGEASESNISLSAPRTVNGRLSGRTKYQVLPSIVLFFV